ncbi:response regulator [Streptacidiphilus carbonis]|uniref:response regulator n=1 Tax=Streptacidiphilus carbonis TaxID=105422 RepID=UPI000B30FE7A|nr:response regulator [Streptacidiphilus carbonis]
MRRYAARRYIDAGTVSRYLNGTRVPPWNWVVDLFKEVAAEQNGAPTPLALEHIKALHHGAGQVTSPVAHGVDVLQQQLAEADRQARQAGAAENVLGEALLDRQHRIADLEVRLNLLEVEWNAERNQADQLREEAEAARGLEEERRSLARQVSSLERELEEARLKALAAESRCDLLERQLAVIERALPAGRGPASTDLVLAGSRARVLIVDDQHANLLALEAVLVKLGHEVVCASSGEEALKALLDSDSFAVILLDVQMPEMDGYETATHIKRRDRNRNIPIIFLTAMDMDPTLELRGYTVGAVDYIVKPFDPWIIRAKVEVFVQIHLGRTSG